VLVVDDYAMMRRIIRNLLDQIGYPAADEAADGAAAWRKLQDSPYGLVIADWYMEPMSGFELLQKVRADERTRDLPVIMVTAERNYDNVVAAKEAGVDNYIVKPFNGDLLRRKIEAALHASRERQAAREAAAGLGHGDEASPAAAAS
jgi:two-component system chemotaxis response regulator CheY